MQLNKSFGTGVLVALVISGLSGCNNEDNGLLGEGETQKEVVTGSSLVSIDGNSADGQSFPVGLPVQLTFTADFTDGTTYSTDDAATDNQFMDWVVEGNTGATVSKEGVLNTTGVPVGTTLTVVATGKSPYDSESDSIDVVVSDAVPVEGSSLVSIDGNSADGQSFPVGLPVQL
ncbi:hypothetical protein NB545_09605, partial [Vibrio campbellii]|uniref:hypothetical protein n=1 Tax=Vibrio campbellii TaxID=680 RepID=UPI00215CB942